MNKKMFQIVWLSLAAVVLGFLFTQWVTATGQDPLPNTACPTATATATLPPPPTPPGLQPHTEAAPKPCSYLPFIQHQFGTLPPNICPSPTPEASPTQDVIPTSPPFQPSLKSTAVPCVTTTPFPTVAAPTPAPA